MAANIPALTRKGQEALSRMPADLTAKCRNILVQVDGKRSLDQIRNTLRGLLGFDEALNMLITGEYIAVSMECKDIVMQLVRQMLGPKAPTLIKKIDEMHSKYGEACWEHIDELDKTARLFYGEVIADKLKIEITRILSEIKG